MVRGRHDEVTRPLTLQRADVAESGELVVAGELVLGILVDVELLALLAAFDEVALHEHLDLQTQVVVVRVAADPQEVEPVPLVDRVLHVVELALVLLEELVRVRVRGEHDGLVQLALEWAVEALDQAIGAALLGLLRLLSLDLEVEVAAHAVHVDLARVVPVRHALLVRVLVAGLGEVRDEL